MTKDIERIPFLDWIRVVACFMVMLVHASENFFGADSSGIVGDVSVLANESNRFWIAFYDHFVARTCVPLFIIVSAYLLVPMRQGVTMAQFYKHRFGRILPPFVFFLLLYCFLPALWGAMTWADCIASFKTVPFNFPPMGGHLWFMYPLISLYLIIPVVSPWLERATAKEVRLFLYLFAFTTFIPFLHKFVSPEIWGECFWNEFHAFWYCSGYLGYLVLAHYIRRHLHWGRSKRLRVGLLTFLAGATFTAGFFWWWGVPGIEIPTTILEGAGEFCTPNVLLATFGAFLMFSCIEQKKTPKVVTELSRLSYGMYLMHLFFLSQIAAVVVGEDKTNPMMPVWLAIPFIAASSYICCAVTAKIFSMLPFSKYTVGA